MKKVQTSPGSTISESSGKKEQRKWRGETIKEPIQENFLQWKDMTFQIKRAYRAPKTMDVLELHWDTSQTYIETRHYEIANSVDKDNILETFGKEKQDSKKNQVSEWLQISQQLHWMLETSRRKWFLM